MTNLFRAAGLAAALVAFTACTGEQRDTVDSAAGTALDATRATFSVIDIDMGRHIDTEKKISDKTDTFAASDTIYASVHTSGTLKDGANVVGRWTFADGSVVDEKPAGAAATTLDRMAFFITKPGGLTKGKYTFRILVDGNEVRSKEVTVQ
jgi:hypothetical protein